MKIHFRIHPAGAAVCAAAFLLMESHEVLAIISALLIHEAAHLIAMICCGMKQCCIELTPFGGVADVASFDVYSPMKKALVAASGVAVSAALGLGMQYLRMGNLFAVSFYKANVSLALMNILPAWPLDGARIVTAFAGLFGCENKVKKLLACISRVLGALFVGLGLYGIWKGIVNLSILLIGPYLCYAADAECAHEKVKRLSAIEQKMHFRESIPVEIHATTVQKKDELEKLFLNRLQYGRYLLLLQLDQKNGKLKKCWTENTLLHYMLDDGMNYRSEDVDKYTGL